MTLILPAINKIFCPLLLNKVCHIMFGSITGSITGNATEAVSNIIILIKYLESIQGGVSVTDNCQ